MKELGLELAKLSVEIQKTSQSISEFTEEWKFLRNKYTFFGWILLNLGLLK